MKALEGVTLKESAENRFYLFTQAEQNTYLFHHPSCYLNPRALRQPAHELLVSCRGCYWQAELFLWVHLHLTSWQHKPWVMLHYWWMSRNVHRLGSFRRWYLNCHARREHSEAETSWRCTELWWETNWTIGSNIAELCNAVLSRLWPLVKIACLRCSSGAWIPITISSSWNFMVVLALICRDDGFEIIWGSLHMLAYPASRVCAFVVAPTEKKGVSSLIMSYYEAKTLLSFLTNQGGNLNDTKADLGFGFPLTTFCPYLRQR